MGLWTQKSYKGDKNWKNITNIIDCHHCHKRVTVSQKSHVMYITIRMIFPEKLLYRKFQTKTKEKVMFCLSFMFWCTLSGHFANIPWEIHEKYTCNGHAGGEPPNQESAFLGSERVFVSSVLVSNMSSCHVPFLSMWSWRVLPHA